MDALKKLALTMTPLALLFAIVQCTSDEPETQSANCDCQKAKVAVEKKGVEAIVVFHRAPDIFMLSTEPKDFEGTTYSIGKNILVPCDSLPEQYQKARTKLIISYKRKDCYGAITDPNLRTNYGYFVELTSVGVKP